MAQWLQSHFVLDPFHFCVHLQASALFCWKMLEMIWWNYGDSRRFLFSCHFRDFLFWISIQVSAAAFLKMFIMSYEFEWNSWRTSGMWSSGSCKKLIAPWWSDILRGTERRCPNLQRHHSEPSAEFSFFLLLLLLLFFFFSLFRPPFSPQSSSGWSPICCLKLLLLFRIFSSTFFF